MSAKQKQNSNRLDASTVKVKVSRMPRTPTTYWDYIRTEKLLSLQAGIEKDESLMTDDEVMFIVIHQIDELWFKLILRQLQSVRDLFAQPHVKEQSIASAVRGLRRVEKLFHQVANHFQLMESMTTRDYLSFRDKLNPASGFQSAQLRQIEIVLGLKDENRIPLGHEHNYTEALRDPDGTPSPAYKRVMATKASEAPTLKEAIHRWLVRAPIQGSRPTDEGDTTVVTKFINSYLEGMKTALTSASQLAQNDALTDKDEARLRARFEKEEASARSFLTAEDAPAQERESVQRVRAAILFIESYRELPLLAWPREVLDAVIAMEQASVIFRQRHARMVERIIGQRTGTGGSAGVAYLDSTALRYRVFSDIWAVRTLLLRQDYLPEVDDPGFYGLRVSSPD